MSCNFQYHKVTKVNCMKLYYLYSYVRPIIMTSYWLYVLYYLPAKITFNSKYYKKLKKNYYLKSLLHSLEIKIKAYNHIIIIDVDDVEELSDLQIQAQIHTTNNTLKIILPPLIFVKGVVDFFQLKNSIIRNK